MATVDIRLNRYQYRFRRLTYREEFGLDHDPALDARKLVLAAAMTEVSGLPIASRADATLILSTIPMPVLNRVWVLYRAAMEEDRFFSTTNLYRAPEPHELRQLHEGSEERRAKVVDRTMDALEQKFGKQEVAEAMVVERRLLEDARRRGSLTKATERNP